MGGLGFAHSDPPIAEYIIAKLDTIDVAQDVGVAFKLFSKEDLTKSESNY